MKKSRESVKLYSRNASLEAEHNANNAFVKSAQAAVAGMAGKNPSGGCGEYNAYMTNTGEKTASFGRTLTAGLDKKAYPVK